MFDTYVRAVRSVMNSSAPISLLDIPWPEQAHDVLLAVGQRLDRLGVLLRAHPLGEQPRDLGVEVDLARVRGADRLGDLLGLRVLEHVARRAGLERRGDLLLLDEARHGDDLRLGELGLDPADRRDAVHVRHQEIHQHDVRREPAGHGHALRAVGRLAHDVDVGQEVEEGAEAHPDDGVIVDEEHANALDVVRHQVLRGARRPWSRWQSASAVYYRIRPVPRAGTGLREGSRDRAGRTSVGASAAVFPIESTRVRPGSPLTRAMSAWAASRVDLDGDAAVHAARDRASTGRRA